MKRSPGTTNSIAWSVSDSCEIELDDFDNALQFPNTEAKVTISLGYQGKGLTKIGTYYVKEITFDGARRVIKIVANALPKSMRSQKTKTNDVKLNEYMSAIDSDLFAEGPLILRGFPEKIPTNWIISRVEHNLSSNGFTTRVECCGQC